jgi:hypothetical protein
VWTTGEASSQRFPDADVAGPVFAAGTRLEVLVREGDRVRVRAGEDYGWVSASLVTAVAPEGAESAEPDDAMLQDLLRQLGQSPAAPAAPVVSPAPPAP